MARTQQNGKYILDGSIQRADIDAVTPGQAVIRKILPGTNVTITSTGPDAGTGDVTINATSGGTTTVKGTEVLDFSAGNIARTTVTGQAWVTASSAVDVYVNPVATATHSEDEHIMITPFLGLNVPSSSIVAGVGFDIVGTIEDKSLLLGSLNVRWVGE